MKIFILALLAFGASFAPQKSQTFTGTITDDACGKGGHAQMRMGPTDADCTNACVSAHGTAYALTDGKALYLLKSREKLEKFAAQKVSIVGTLDTKTNTIQVDSITVSK
jgi:hypothetical protein